MYFNTLILDYFHYISAITEIFKKQNYVRKISSSPTLLVTFDQWLVYRVGTVRGRSLKMRKWIYITLHKFISQYLICSTEKYTELLDDQNTPQAIFDIMSALKNLDVHLCSRHSDK